MDRERSAFADARSQIAARIRRVCSHLDELEFGQLVDKMAEIEVRYRLRDDWILYRDALAHHPKATGGRLN